MARFVHLTLPMMLAASAMTACKDPPPKPPPVPQEMPLAPGAALHTEKPDEVRVRTDLAIARTIIREYEMTHDGKHPPNLESLGFRPHFPKDLVYNAASGAVRSLTYRGF